MLQKHRFDVPKKATSILLREEKRHTLKTQLVVNQSNKAILCLDFSEGKKHDFNLFNEARLPLTKTTKLLADSGYLGVKKQHACSEHTVKGSEKYLLTKEDKAYNRELFSLRMNLIAGIHNYELAAK